MKVLPLKMIVRQINGRIIRGKTDLMIEHVVHRLKYIKPNLLYFHRKPAGWKPDLNMLPAVVVTDTPSYFIRRTPDHVTIVTVKDIEAAYLRFVQFYRSLFSIPVIGVTGTCGKTTTVEMIKQILSTRLRIQATRDGENGLSQNISYLTSIDDRTEAAVFEMGTDSPGVIRRSSKYFKPTVGVILNIGVYHLKYSGALENYIEAKSEMVEGIAPGGTLILNADDENIRKIDIRSFQGKIVTFGMKQGYDYWSERISEMNGGSYFTLHHRDQRYRVFVPGYGVHNIYNAMAAIAACHAIGMGLNEAIRSLSVYQPMRMHMEFRKGLNGCTIINDSWNCNPPGMKAALQVLCDQAKGRNTVAVLGFMPQLGENGRYEYLNIGELVIKTNVDHLIIVGKEARSIGLKAMERGMSPRRVQFCETGKEVFQALLPHLHPNSLVLLKIPYYYRLSENPSFQKLMKKIME